MLNDWQLTFANTFEITITTFQHDFIECCSEAIMLITYMKSHSMFNIVFLTIHW